MLAYNEPDDKGNNLIIQISEEEAIRRQRASASLKGYIYASDETALMDFMVIHWAWQTK
jgi:hypothetical protein